VNLRVYLSLLLRDDALGVSTSSFVVSHLGFSLLILKEKTKKKKKFGV
jgi:hypothetical protein